MTPVSVMEDWMKKDEGERKAVEDKMKADWTAWSEKNKAGIVDMPSGVGKTKSVATSGTTDIKNNIMMYAIVQADSQDEAVKMFASHPHLEIPQSTIEIMGINAMM